MNWKKGIMWGMILVLFWGMLLMEYSWAEDALTIALLPFIDRNNEEPHWGYLIRDWIKRVLEEQKNVEVPDVFSVDNLVRASRISWDTLFVPTAAQSLGKRANCDYVLIGSFRHREVAGRDRIIVTPRLHRLVQGDYIDIPSEMFDGERMDLAALYVAQKTMEVLGIETFFSQLSISVPSLVNLFPLYQGLIKVDEAIRTYGEKQYPDQPLWREAFALVGETIRREPAYLETYYYLANMYRETGWWAKEAETWDLYLRELNHGRRVNASLIAQVYLRLAYSYFHQKSLDLAIANLTKATELNPNLVEAYLLLGRIYYESDRTDEAEKAYAKAYELDPHSKEAQYFFQLAGKARIFGKSAYEAYTQGYQYFAQGSLPEAEEYLKEAIHLNPSFKEAYYWLGRTLYEAGKLSEAEKAWGKVLELDPFNSQARRFLDRTQQEKKYGRKAVRNFQSGYERYEKGNYQEAIEFFKEAIVENPAFSEAHEYLARCYYRLGRTKEYVEERERVASLLSTPEDKAWYAYNTGYELFAWGEREKAKAWLEQAISVNDALGEAHLLLGEIYGEKGEWSKALSHYLKAKDNLEGEMKGQALWGIATADFELKQFGDLVLVLEEIIMNYPYAEFMEEAEALRIEVLVRTQDYKRARLAFQQFQIQFPESRFLEKASFFYALSFYEEGKWPEALTALKRFTERYPRSDFSSQVLEMLGYVYRHLGREEEARSTFEKLKGDEGTFLAADSWYRQKDWEQAIIAFTQYLSSYPQGKFLIEARLKLASSYLEKGMVQEAGNAIRSLEGQILNVFPVDFLRFRVKLRFQQEDWQGVVDDLIVLEEKTGRLEEEYLLILALAYHQLGRKEQAEEVLRQAGKNPEEILGDREAELLKKALEAMEKGDYFTVISQLGDGTGFTNRQHLVHFLLGKAHYFLSHFDEAYDHLSRSLASSEEGFFQEACFYLLDLAYRKGDWSGVIQFYRKLSEVRGPEILWRVAVAYYKEGNLPESRKILEDLITVDTVKEKAVLLLLEELYALKEYQAFLETVWEFFRSYPQHPEKEELLYLASWSAYFVGKMDESKKLISSYRTEFPQGKHEEELMSLLADILIQESAYEEAVGVLENLVHREGWSLENRLYAWYRLGTVFLRIQEFGKAADAFQHIVQAGESAYFDRAAYYLGMSWEYLENLEEAVKAYRLTVEKSQDSLWKSKAEERLALLTQE
ncbi:MAG: tetratricopeptide repeat protein [Atribacterota bacterium]